MTKASATLKTGLLTYDAASLSRVRSVGTLTTPSVTAGERNGGGWLIDGDWHIRIAYYDFVIRG